MHLEHRNRILSKEDIDTITENDGISSTYSVIGKVKNTDKTPIVKELSKKLSDNLEIDFNWHKMSRNEGTSVVSLKPIKQKVSQTVVDIKKYAFLLYLISI